AKFVVMNFVGGIRGGEFDGFIEGHIEIEKFGKDVAHIFHSSVHAADVKVGGDGIGMKALMNSGICLARVEAAAAMADVENNAALFRVEKIGTNFALRVEHGDEINVHVSGDVAGAKFLRDELFVRALGAEDAEVHHDRNLREIAGFEGTID